MICLHGGEGVIALLLALTQVMDNTATRQDPVPAASSSLSVPDDIVVTARRNQCDVRIADRLMSHRAFREKAREWAAGRPVRVLVPRSSSLRCQAEIMFRLNRHGVTRAIFVDQDQ